MYHKIFSESLQFRGYGRRSVVGSLILDELELELCVGITISEKKISVFENALMV